MRRRMALVPEPRNAIEMVLCRACCGQDEGRTIQESLRPTAAAAAHRHVGSVGMRNERIGSASDQSGPYGAIVEAVIARAGCTVALRIARRIGHLH